MEYSQNMKHILTPNYFMNINANAMCAISILISNDKTAKKTDRKLKLDQLNFWQLPNEFQYPSCYDLVTFRFKKLYKIYSG